MAIIETENLTKIYKLAAGGELIAVDNLTFEVQAGEIFGFLGPNGSGKTTTIKMLLGLTFKTYGKAYIFGKEPRDVNSKHKIGYLPEMPYLYEFLTPVETLKFYGELFGIEGKLLKRRIDELLELVGLSAVRSMQVGKFSKGMRQRLNVAQALINDPELLFLDELTWGMDPIGAKEMKDLMLSLKAAGKTIFYSTHMLADAEAICDRVAIITDGKLITMGKLDELLYASGFMELSARRVSPQAQAKIRALGLELQATDEKVSVTLADERLLINILHIILPEGAEVLNFAPKRESLEELFFRVVKEAQEARSQEIQKEGINK